MAAWNLIICVEVKNGVNEICRGYIALCTINIYFVE